MKATGVTTRSTAKVAIHGAQETSILDPGSMESNMVQVNSSGHLEPNTLENSRTTCEMTTTAPSNGLTVINTRALSRRT